MAYLTRWLQLRFDFDSTAIRPRYDHSTTYVTIDRAAALRRQLDCVRLAGYITLHLVTFDKQLNARGTPSKSGGGHFGANIKLYVQDKCISSNKSDQTRSQVNGKDYLERAQITASIPASHMHYLATTGGFCKFSGGG